MQGEITKNELFIESILWKITLFRNLEYNYL